MEGNMGLAARKVAAMREVLRRVKHEGHIIHVGLYVCQADCDEDLNVALRILWELEAEHPTSTWHQLHEWGVED